MITEKEIMGIIDEKLFYYWLYDYTTSKYLPNNQYDKIWKNIAKAIIDKIKEKESEEKCK